MSYTCFGFDHVWLTKLYLYRKIQSCQVQKLSGPFDFANLYRIESLVHL
jgi:hypothetical protein